MGSPAFCGWLIIPRKVIGRKILIGNYAAKKGAAVIYILNGVHLKMWAILS